MNDTIRIFVGCAANDDDLESQAVLEYTLTKHTNHPLKITWMQQSRDPDSWFYVGPGGWVTTGWATPFSGFRWLIPFMAQSEDRDRAIYMDSDFIVFGDIADLWNTKFQSGRAVVARGDGRYCCSLWNVPQALTYLAASYVSMRSDPNLHPLMSASYAKHPSRVQPFTALNQWNWLDHDHVPLDQLSKRGIKAIHYTRIEMQLQIKHAVARLAKEGRRHWSGGKSKPNDWPGLQDLFDKLLEEAQCSGFALERYVVEKRFGDIKIRR